MTDPEAQPQFSWTCPACARRVPNRIGECRCGALRPDDQLAPTADEFPTRLENEEPPPGVPGAISATASWMALGIVAIVAVGILIALQSGSPTPQPEAELPLDVTVAIPSSDVQPAPAAVAPVDQPAASTFAGGPSTSLSDTATPARAATPRLEDVVSRSIPAIVSIETADGRGSGFFAGRRTVITNRHVVQSNVSVTVRLSSGQTLPGRVDSSSAEYDLAVVRVDGAAPDHAVLPLSTANDVRPGQEVIAIGLALGVFQNSVTRGIISAVRRSGRTVMLQTDAAINAGNSGGPLLNVDGQVVGINTMKIAGAAESVGFAVAVDHARGMLNGTRQPDTTLSATAPISQPLAPGFSTRSSIDGERAQGTRRYAQTIEAIARQAALLDGYWTRIKANCAVRVAPGYDREWFGLWDGRTTVTAPDPSCGSAMRDLERLATEVRGAMSSAEEEARRASGLPGELRDIRRRYRMDWPGWR